MHIAKGSLARVLAFNRVSQETPTNSSHFVAKKAEKTTVPKVRGKRRNLALWLERAANTELSLQLTSLPTENMDPRESREERELPSAPHIGSLSEESSGQL